MTDEPGGTVAGAAADIAAPERVPHDWVGIAVLLIASIVVLIVFLLWLPGAFASPSGGCGGG